MIHPIRPYPTVRFGQPALEPRPVKSYADYLCHCYDKTENELTRAIQDEHLQTLKEVQKKTEAGTGCGACVLKIQCLLKKLMKGGTPQPTKK